MNELLNIVMEKHGVPVTTSLKVAEKFKKEHRRVLQDIRELGCSEQFRLHNFVQSSYTNFQRKKQPMYQMTRDGFVLLVMGYTGKDAMKFKEDYIQAFNKMESFIKSLQEAKMDYPALTKAVEQAHEEPKSYHFSNETNMINRIVLGMDAKHFKKQCGIDKKENSIRPYLTAEQIKAVEELQRIDTGLLVAHIEFEQRKKILTEYFYKNLIGNMQISI